MERELEKEFDHKLNIRTGGIREWSKKSFYNRCEATPYTAFLELFKYYTLPENAKVVDFGAGRGRTAFYFNYHYDVPVTGIELNEETIEEAETNLMTYQRRHPEKKGVFFQFGYAEQYDYQKEDNVYYFFNPFKGPVFQRVLDRIMADARIRNKQIDIIFYYPIEDHQRILNREADLRLIHNFKVESENDPYATFEIYRFTPEIQEEK